jgi:hypothetical protein
VVNRFSANLADTKGQDVFIFVVSDAGQMIYGHQVSFNPSDKSYLVDTTLGINALRSIGNYYAFAGNALGYGTIYQSEAFADTQPNSFVMKILFQKSTNYQCLFEGAVRDLSKIKVTDISPGVTRYNADLSYSTS